MTDARHASPSWILPLACAVIPAVAVHAAWLLSLQAGSVPDCIPHFEGCTSISRAARHGHANLLFKALMLPCALLQALHWRSAARWMAARHPSGEAGRALVPLGVVAAVALAAYTAALGTEGAFYQWMRRFGITFYFGATFLAILAYERRLLQVPAQRALARSMLAVCGLMLLAGLASVAARSLAEPALKERIENVLEWQIGILLTAWFLMQAAAWRRPRPAPSAGAG